MDALRYKTGLKRLGASIVDGVIILGVTLLGRWIFDNIGNEFALQVWSIFNVLFPLCYSIILHYKYGQTFGKWVVSVKVLDIGEERTLTLRQAVLRDAFYAAFELIGLLYFIFAVANPDNGYLYFEYRNIADQAAFWWTVSELMTMLTNAKRRAIHDYLAKSVVIRV